MAEYIKREDILKFPIRRNHCDKENANEHFISGIETVMEFIEILPAADVAEVMHGRWEEVDWIEFDVHGLETTRIPKAGLRCSRCSNVFKKELLWKDNYCPNCGACMDKEDEHEAD